MTDNPRAVPKRYFGKTMIWASDNLLLVMRDELESELGVIYHTAKKLAGKRNGLQQVEREIKLRTNSVQGKLHDS